MSNTLILGPTGNIGAAIIRQYIKREQSADLLTAGRNQERISSLFNGQVNTAFFDFNDESSYDIFQKVKKVFMLAPPKGPDQLTIFINVLQHLKAANIQHLTFLSGRTTGDVVGYPLREMEALISNSRLPFTILRPSWFMQDFLTWWQADLQNENKIYLPLKDFPISFVHVDDIGELGFLSLRECPAALQNKITDISGPEALTITQIAEIYSNQLGRQITYVDLSPTDYHQHLLDVVGWPEKTAKFMNVLFDLVKTGKERAVNLENEQVLGRKLISFEAFVAENKAAW